MGKLIEGVWYDTWYNTQESKGRFVREDAGFRQWVRADKRTKFNAESGRYHLYVSLACPWAHRTLIYRKLKGLEPHIAVTVVDPEMMGQGWEISKKEPLFGFQYLYQLYVQCEPQYTGRVTVPVLWDTKLNVIVSNESSEIIRMFNSEFNHITGNDLDFYPEKLRHIIDEWNNFVYPNINNGVYRCGFATTQEAYDEAFLSLFNALDQLDNHLHHHRYLVGDTITEADWRLFTTLVRFDPVYVGHFKCNKKRIADYVHLYGYLKELYQLDGIAETTDFEHIKRHYYFSHKNINPTQVIPQGPYLELYSAHGRDFL